MKAKIKIGNVTATVNVDFDLVLGFNLVYMNDNLATQTSQFKELLQQKVAPPAVLSSPAVVTKIIEVIGKAFEMAKKRADKMEHEIILPKTIGPIKAKVKVDGKNVEITIDSDVFMVFQMFAISEGGSLVKKIREFKSVMRNKISDPNLLNDPAFGLKLMEIIGEAFNKAKDEADKIEVAFDPPIEEG